MDTAFDALSTVTVTSTAATEDSQLQPLSTTSSTSLVPPPPPTPSSVYAAILVAATLPIPNADATTTTTSPLHVNWPCLMPTPTDATEFALRSVLLRGKKKYEWGLLNPRSFEDLSSGARAAIISAAQTAGVELGQALSLRSHLLKSAAPHLFHGFEAGAEAVALRLEAHVGRFLDAAGVSYTTQAGLAAIAAR
jgi:hypothetical protein